MHGRRNYEDTSAKRLLHIDVGMHSKSTRINQFAEATEEKYEGKFDEPSICNISSRASYPQFYCQKNRIPNMKNS